MVAVQIEPLLLKPLDAGKAIGRSAAWLRKRRFDDLKRVDAGERIEGPAWVVVEGMCHYRPRDLADWVARTAQPLARAPSG